MADFVASSRLDVVVDSYCASGCSQSVFLAGLRKRVGPDALLLMHWEIGPEDVPPRARPALAYYYHAYDQAAAVLGKRNERSRIWERARAQLRREQISPALLGYAMAITLAKGRAEVVQSKRSWLFGLIETNQVRVNVRPPGGSAWMPSRADLERFGVRGLVEYPERLDPALLEPVARGSGINGRIVIGDIEKLVDCAIDPRCQFVGLSPSIETASVGGK